MLGPCPGKLEQRPPRNLDIVKVSIEKLLRSQVSHSGFFQPVLKLAREKKVSPKTPSLALGGTLPVLAKKAQAEKFSDVPPRL